MITKLGKSNPKIKELKELYKKNNHDNMIIVEDLNSLEIILNNDVRIFDFFYCPDIEYHDDTKLILNEAINKAINTYEISKAIFDSLSLKSDSIGFIALADAPVKSLDDLKDYNFLVIADHLENPGNLGTIYRTMDSTRVDGMVLVDPITKYNNPKLTLSARGCNLIIPTACDTYDNVLKFLLDNNFDIFLGEPKLGLDYQKYDYKGKIAIVVGNERFGINSDWYNHNHKKVFIPMEGNNNSLNVSVAASILIYEAYMKRKTTSQ